MDKSSKKCFLHIRFGLRAYIVDAKNRIFAIFSVPAISKNVIISDIFGRTLVSIDPSRPIIIPKPQSINVCLLGKKPDQATPVTEAKHMRKSIRIISMIEMTERPAKIPI